MAKSPAPRGGARLVRDTREERLGHMRVDAAWLRSAFLKSGLHRWCCFATEAASLLRRWTQLKSHRFWASPPADNPEIYARALGHQQVNDAWLVEAGRRNGGRLVTLDTQSPAHAAWTGEVEVIKI